MRNTIITFNPISVQSVANSLFYSEAPVVRDRVEHVGVGGRTGESEAHEQLPDLRGGAPIDGRELDRVLVRALGLGDDGSFQ